MVALVKYYSAVASSVARSSKYVSSMLGICSLTLDSIFRLHLKVYASPMLEHIFAYASKSEGGGVRPPGLPNGEIVLFRVVRACVRARGDCLVRSG